MGKAIRIAVEDVVVSRRGRTAEYDSDLLEDLESLTSDEALDLGPYFGTPESKEDRQKVGADIRKHWAAVRTDKCRIDFGAGTPQVRVKATSEKS